jgi:hypothetical protein
MIRKSFFILALSALHLIADEPEKTYWDYHPIHGGANLIWLGNADVTPKKAHHSDGELFFQKSNAFLSMILPVHRTTFFIPKVEWNNFNMSWNKNPKFNKTHYYYLQFALTFFTTAIEKWKWILRADYNFDLAHTSNPGPYGLFSALIWGNHEINDQWHYHVGALAFAGLRGDQIYPVIGLDYAPNNKWLIQVIFPITYSIEYNLTKSWRLSLKGRPIKERFRTNQKEPQPGSIFNYSTIGAEFNIHYDIPFRLQLDFFGGYNFGGDFYIKDSGGHHALYTSVGGAPYGGASLDFGF